MATDEGQVISCHTIDSWIEQLHTGNQSKKLIVIDFTASWCPPNRFLDPYLSDLAKKVPEAIFLKVNCDQLQAVAADWSIETFPTFLFLKEGKIVDKVEGARREEVHEKTIIHSATVSA